MHKREAIEANAENDGCEQPEKQRASRADRIKAWRFKPGQSGNPSGRPKSDISAIIARAVFENNADMLYKAYAKALSKGSGFTFQVLSDRAYGKLKESVEVSGNISLSERMEKARKRSTK